MICADWIYCHAPFEAFLHDLSIIIYSNLDAQSFVHEAFARSATPLLGVMYPSERANIGQSQHLFVPCCSPSLAHETAQ